LHVEASREKEKGTLQRCRRQKGGEAGEESLGERDEVEVRLMMNRHGIRELTTLERRETNFQAAS